MDQTHTKENPMDEQKKKYQRTLKKVTTQLLFSLSLFSFLFALPIPKPSWPWLPFFHFYQPIDKNSMFLLCNGLLVFLANYSGLFKSLSSSSSSSYPPRDSNFRLFFELTPLSADPIVLELPQKPPLIDPTETETSENQQDEVAEHLEEDEEDEEDQDNSYGLRESFFAEEEEEGIENGCGGGGVLSDEELNRKFDEFIKRMKQEIILDHHSPPRTLVVV